MRLKDVLDVLTKSVPLLDFQTQQVPGSPMVLVVRRKQTQQGLRLLATIAPFATHAKSLLARPPMQADSVDPSEFERFKADAIRLLERAKDLQATVEQVVEPTPELSLSIRIPKPATLDDLTHTVRELQTIFEKPAMSLLGSRDGQLAFEGFDVGSDWIEIGFATYLGLQFGVALLNAATSHQTNKAKADQEVARAQHLQAEARELNAKASVVEVAASFQKELLAAARLKLSKQLVAAFKEHQAPDVELNEAQNLIGVALEKWTGLRERGATVKAALNAPSDIRENMADPEKPLELTGFEEQLKLLAERATNAGEPK